MGPASARPAQCSEVLVSATNPFSRRRFVRICGLAAAGLAGAGPLLRAERLLALAPPGPDAPEPPNEQVAKILREIAGDRPIRTGHVQLDMPVIAEDGRVVPVMIESDLPMGPGGHVESVHLVVDYNPDPHLAAFHLTPALGRVSLSTRIKMKRTTWVRAIAKTSTGDVWADYARVQVTLNGCG
jgi:sulfur-oxidizing protein SoxY